MTKIAQSNYKPKEISENAILKRIKEGTHVPQPKNADGTNVGFMNDPRWSNDPTGKGEDDHPETKAMVNLMDKFEQINAKNNCMRVRFYDWFADYLEKTAIKIRDRAAKITNSCSITLPSLKSKKVIETELVKDTSKSDTISMKIPDEEVKKIVPDLTPAGPDDDKIIAVKNATEIANAMIKAGNQPETFKITPDIQRAIEVVAKAEVEYTKTLEAVAMVKK